MRALIAVAAVLLVAAGCSSAPKPGTASSSSSSSKSSTAGKAAPNEVLAQIGDVTLTKADYETRLNELPAQYRSQVSTPEQKRQFIDRLIEERVWLEAAEKAKVEERPEIKNQLASARRDLLIRTYLGEKMQTAPAPSDSVLEAYYNANADKFMTEEQVKVRHIQVKDEKTAKTVGRELKKPNADFAKLAEKYSTDTVTKNKGGDLGPVGRSGFFGSLGQQRALADTAFALAPNTVAGPIKTALGYQFIEVTEKIAPHARPFEEVKQVIQRQMSQTSQQDFYKESLAAEKSALGVRVDSTNVNALANEQKSAVEMFREAGEMASVEERVATYRRLVELYPDSEYAPQALFMVGFVESEEKREYDEAEAAFKELIQRYPNSELASSAQWMIDNMRSDKTPDFELPGGMGKASEHDAPENTGTTPPSGKP